MASLVIGADICPIERNLPYFVRGDVDALFGDILPVLRKADYVIANLECPLVDRHTPITKTGPTFGESTRCVNGVVGAGIRALGLANNHIMDHGPEGLESTLRACAQAGIATVGAGPNLESARQPLVVDIAGLRVAIMAMAEREFSIADVAKPGAAPVDLVAAVRFLKTHRSKFDYLVVLFHGSDEFFVPTPRVQETCRFLIEMGANAVLVQHPHVVGGFETHLGGHIIYGQGAFVMDEAIYRDRPSFHEGYLAKLEIHADATSALEVIPFQQSTDGIGARRMGPEAEARFHARLRQVSERLADPALVAKEWTDFCARHRHEYMSTALGYGRILSRLNRTGLMARLLHRRIDLLRVRNIITCETHREAMQTLFDGGFLP